MKRVVTNSQVAHLWAEQSQESARNGKGSLFFENEVIYSYGHHWPIARITGIRVDEGNAPEIVLFHSGTYSATTSQHRGAAVHALNGRNALILAVPAPESGSHRQNLNYLREQFNTAISKLKKARTVERPKPGWDETELVESWFIRDTRARLQDFNLYAQYIAKISDRLSLPDGFSAIAEAAYTRSDKFLAKRHEAWERYHQAEEARRIARAEEERLHLAEWLKGTYHGQLYNLDRTFLRLKDADTVQTTRGAEVPVADARRAYNRILLVMESGQKWERNGGVVRVGAFQLDSIDADGTVKAGCHTLHFAEIQDFAQRMGWAEEGGAA